MTTPNRLQIAKEEFIERETGLLRPRREPDGKLTCCEMWELSWKGVYQGFRGRRRNDDDVGGNIYSIPEGDERRDDFERDINQWVEGNLLDQYIALQVTDPQHSDNIVELAREGTALGYGILENNVGCRFDKNEESGRYNRIEERGEYTFRIGIAQKLLNLRLKYMWCLGRIEKIPHCTLDNIILEKAAGIGEVKWSRINHISSYNQVIEDLQEIAGATPLAEWELVEYNVNRDN